MSNIVLRASAGEGFIRAFVADTRELVNTAAEKQKTLPVVTATLGRLLTAGAMMSYMQKNSEDRLTLKIKGDGPVGAVIVTSDGGGRVKGFAENPYVDIPLKENGKLDVSGAVGTGHLSVIKDMGLKEPYLGEVELVTGEIAEDLTYYFSTSEQVPSAVGLGVLVDKDLSVKRAGGFIIQLLPFAPDEIIEKLENNLRDFTSVTQFLSEHSAEELLESLLKDLNPTVTDTYEPVFVCDCSRKKVLNAISKLATSEINSMIDDGEDINVHCDFCNTDYNVSVAELKDMLRGKL